MLNLTIINVETIWEWRSSPLSPHVTILVFVLPLFKGFNVRFTDNLYDNDARHGYIGVNVRGAWGTICPDTWDENAATVACRQLGFTGGVNYLPFGTWRTICPDNLYENRVIGAYKSSQFRGGWNYFPNDYAEDIIFLHGLSCSGHESSLMDCHPKDYAGDKCDYPTVRAGALCYQGSGMKPNNKVINRVIME